MVAAYDAIFDDNQLQQTPTAARAIGTTIR
jgi:hypothetical protein